MAADVMTDLLAEARWEAAPTAPDEVDGPDGLAEQVQAWSPVRVPAAIGASVDGIDPDTVDWWYRTTVDVAPGRWWLQACGLATVADVWVDGVTVLHSDSMWRSHWVDLGEVSGSTAIVLRFAALAPVLARRRPRPRWRSGLVRHQNLRWHRTSIWGRMPAMPEVPAPAGPWRPLRLVPAGATTVRSCRLTARPAGVGGRITVEADIAGIGPADDVRVAAGGIEAPATVAAGPVAAVRATMEIPTVERWWPHTHGSPSLYPVELVVGERRLGLGSVGFRTVTADRSGDGFTLRINDTPVFARGAVWVGPDPIGLAPDPAEVRAALERFVETGFNLVRLAGTGVYEDEAFWRGCDELGLMVWADAAFANLDYPDDPAFTDEVRAEVGEVWGRAGSHPSFAVACGGSEVEQQAAMLGLPAEDWVPATQGEVLPGVVAELGLDVPYVTSSPTGGIRPFSPDSGVAHWFGVGAYLRSPGETRGAGVRFAAECLAVSIPPHDDDRAWDGVPRDAGASWDFADVRDHYVRELLGRDPSAVRYADPQRALDLGRAAAVEMVVGTIGEWRRAASPCAGAVILAWRDVAPGSGWGLVDSTGRPKAPWWALRRLLAPVAVWLVDGGLAGLEVHVANDLALPLTASLRVRSWGPDGSARQPAEVALVVPGRGAATLDIEEVLGGFRDITWAYRFGPPAFDVVLVELVGSDGGALGRAIALPLGAARPLLPDVGLRAVAAEDAAGAWTLAVSTVLLAQHVRLLVDGFEPSDDWFHLEPGGVAHVALRPTGGRSKPGGEVRAINSVAAARIEISGA